MNRTPPAGPGFPARQLGRDVADVGAFQMAIRTIVIYVFSLAIIRIGRKRFLTRASAFDVIVAIMLGSVMSSAINGSTPFFEPGVLDVSVAHGAQTVRIELE